LFEALAVVFAEKNHFPAFAIAFSIRRASTGQ
jgi:hypothetical protein